MPQGKSPTYREKLLQANREAKATVVALALTVVVWIALGFGLAGSSVEVLSTPIWIIGGTVGTWLFAIAVAVFLGKRVFADFDLDDEGTQGAEGVEAVEGVPAAGVSVASAPVAGGMSAARAETAANAVSAARAAVVAGFANVEGPAAEEGGRHE